MLVKIGMAFLAFATIGWSITIGGLSFMMFDSPDNKPGPIMMAIFYLLVLAIIVSPFVGSIFAWRRFFAGDGVINLLWFLLPVLPLIAMFVFAWIVLD
ncbi:MAG: hypothetical protein HKM24_08220 [Gammaproteobacteria bacterium]|nr:hypothetical protein [Gammaproteobacteria bacterium]